MKSYENKNIINKNKYRFLVQIKEDIQEKYYITMLLLIRYLFYRVTYQIIAGTNVMNFYFGWFKLFPYYLLKHSW